MNRINSMKKLNPRKSLVSEILYDNVGILPDHIFRIGCEKTGDEGSGRLG